MASKYTINSSLCQSKCKCIDNISLFNFCLDFFPVNFFVVSDLHDGLVHNFSALFVLFADVHFKLKFSTANPWLFYLLKNPKIPQLIQSKTKASYDVKNHTELLIGLFQKATDIDLASVNGVYYFSSLGWIITISREKNETKKRGNISKQQSMTLYWQVRFLFSNLNLDCFDFRSVIFF